MKRVPGTAVFLATVARDAMPAALLHNLKHNKVLHERVVLLTVADRAGAASRRRDAHGVDRSRGEGFYRIVLRHGFMEEADVPADLADIKDAGAPFKTMDTSYFLARQT